MAHVDCGDNSCICCPPEKKKGMRTNGGCRCFKHDSFVHLSSEDNRKVRRAVLYWRYRAQEREEAWKTLREFVDDVCSRHQSGHPIWWAANEIKAEMDRLTIKSP